MIGKGGSMIGGVRGWAFVVLLAVLAGCASPHYQMTPQEYGSRVRTLGVLPLLVDGSSRVDHPRAAEVVAALGQAASGREERLVELLRQQKAYFDVRRVAGDPRLLLQQLVEGVLPAAGETGGRNYRYSRRGATELAERNVVDALLVVILYGDQVAQKRWDRGRLNYLEADFSAILARAAVVLPTGAVAWEYPQGSGDPLLSLQYPAFDEAFHNRSEEVPLRYVTLEGVGRILTEGGTGALEVPGQPRLFEGLCREIAAALKPRLIDRFRRGGRN